jgi:hypothetical protein
MSREQIIHEALSLNDKDRERLADELLVSVDRLAPGEVEKIWIEEAQRRLEAMENGNSTPLNGPQFMQKLRESCR